MNGEAAPEAAPDALYSEQDKAAAAALTQQLMRSTFASPRDAVLSLKRVEISVLRAMALELTHVKIRDASILMVRKLGKLDLCVLCVGYILSYHQGYGMASADMAHGFNYHEKLTEELGSPVAS